MNPSSQTNQPAQPQGDWDPPASKKRRLRKTFQTTPEVAQILRHYTQEKCMVEGRVINRLIEIGHRQGEL